MGDLTKNFSRREFACTGDDCCGGSAPIDKELVQMLQILRDEVRVPVHISSGFRCNTHNTTVVGASPNSMHTLGLAADIIVPRGHDCERLARQIRDMGLFSGIIAYPDRNFIHLDLRTRAGKKLGRLFEIKGRSPS